MAEYYLEYFTENPLRSSFIFVITKSQIQQKLAEGCVVLIPTGWCNAPSAQIEPNCYVIGYTIDIMF